MKRFLRPLTLALVLSCGIAQAAPDAAAPNASKVNDAALEAAFKAGNAAMERRDYAAALKQYRIVLAAEPDEPSSLWNGGSAAFSTGDYKLAMLYFSRLQKQEPKDGALLAKRVQTAQELNDFKARDALRAEIYALRKSGEDESGYTAKPSYCRDQFFVGKDLVLAFEYWELKPLSGDASKPYLGRVYEFFVVAPNDETRLRIECGWSLLEAKADGSFVPSAELGGFYYDAYYPSGPWSRRTFAVAPQQPSFEAAKAQAIAIIEGKTKPVSGRKRE